MTRLSLFNSPLMLGFEDFERTLDRVAKASSDGYPPYNIERIGRDQLRITLAVAGFRRSDLTVHIEDNQLVVRGKQEEDGGERVFLHRGIAARQFQRAFVLADGIEILGATLENGLLSIDLHRPSTSSRVRVIDIGTPDDGDANGALADRTIEVPAGHLGPNGNGNGTAN